MLRAWNLDSLVRLVFTVSALAIIGCGGGDNQPEDSHRAAPGDEVTLDDDTRVVFGELHKDKPAHTIHLSEAPGHKICVKNSSAEQHRVRVQHPSDEDRVLTNDGDCLSLSAAATLSIEHDGVSEPASYFIVRDDSSRPSKSAKDGSIAEVLHVINFKGCPGCDLSNIDLTMLSLKHSDFSNTNFNNADLSGSDLADSNLDGISINNTDFSLTRFAANTMCDDRSIGYCSPLGITMFTSAHVVGICCGPSPVITSADGSQSCQSDPVHGGAITNVKHGVSVLGSLAYTTQNCRYGDFWVIYLPQLTSTTTSARGPFSGNSVTPTPDLM